VLDINGLAPRGFACQQGSALFLRREASLTRTGDLRFGRRSEWISLIFTAFAGRLLEWANDEALRGLQNDSVCIG